MNTLAKVTIFLKDIHFYGINSSKYMQLWAWVWLKAAFKKEYIAYVFKEQILPFSFIFRFLLQFLVLVNPSYHQCIKKDKGRYSYSLCVILLLNENVAEIYIKKYHLAKSVVFDKYIIPSCNCEEGKSMNLSRNRW